MRTDLRWKAPRLGLAFLLLVAAAPAAALPIWRFETEGISTLPGETVVVHAMATGPGSIGTLQGSQGPALPPAGLQALESAYAVSLISLFLAVPIPLAPGEELRFQWATLTPLGGSAPVGSYTSGDPLMDFGPGPEAPTNGFVIHVIPEPSPALLLAVAMLLVLPLRPWRRPSSSP